MFRARRDCSPVGSPEVEVSFSPLPLFFLLLSVPLCATAGDECRQFLVGEEIPIWPLLPFGFPAPTITTDRRPCLSEPGRVAPLCRVGRGLNFRAKEGTCRSPVSARKEPERKKKEKKRKRRKREKKRKRRKREKKRKEKKDREKERERETFSLCSLLDF